MSSLLHDRSELLELLSPTTTNVVGCGSNNSTCAVMEGETGGRGDHRLGREVPSQQMGLEKKCRQQRICLLTSR